jgi:hypothetical protein
MKASVLSFVFKNFSELGLFKGLRLIQIKKTPFFQTRVPGCAKRLAEDMPNPPGRAKRWFWSAEMYILYFWICQ